MAKLKDICQNVFDEVNGAIGVAIVDLSSGMLLDVVHNVPHFDQDYIDAVSAAAVDMFRGKTISMVEDLLSKKRNKPTTNSIKEVQMTTEGTFHFMAIVPEKPYVLAILITTKRASIGMGWNAIRGALADIGKVCP